ncbi:hypothetical protein B296_00033754 [Ensete ventricosum]|uniref:Uncharacterized protein n=1 Tax=Ensete ventricosum TaxID=4639 RepID=A0A426Y581_ENSVE|nr:hypothetical protein B296_00033754 [Ensete ventricosum]
MKPSHDLDTTVTKGSLAAIKEWYSIPVEYRLHVPQPVQRPYSLDAPGVCIFVDALEAGLRLPLHPTIEECIKWWRISLKVGEAPSIEALRSSSKRPTDTPVPSDDPARRHKKVKILSRRHKSRHGEGGSWSHLKGKEPAVSVEEPEGQAESPNKAGMPVFLHPKSMKDLCGTKVRKDDVGYYTLYMSDLAQQDPYKEMQARWENLINSSKVWSDHATAEEFERGLLHPQLARELYTLPSEVLLARAAKEMVLVIPRLKTASL